MIELTSKVKFAIILTVGIVVPGTLAYAFSMSEFSQVGTIIWVLGYGATIVVIWYNWVRPINFEIIGPEVSVDKQDSPSDHQSTTDNSHKRDENNSTE